jgi:hypothetical protein
MPALISIARLIHPAEFLDAGMHVDQLGCVGTGDLRPGCSPSVVISPSRAPMASTRSPHGTDGLGQQASDSMPMPTSPDIVADVWLSSRSWKRKAAGNRQVGCLRRRCRKSSQAGCGSSRCRPAITKGRLADASTRAQGLQICAQPSADACTGRWQRGVGHGSRLGSQHVLGQRQHHRAGATRTSPPERRGLTYSGTPIGTVDLRHPLGHLARTCAGSRSPGRPRARRSRCRPGRRTRSSAWSPGTPARMPIAALVAPGPRVTIRIPGLPAGELAAGVGHERGAALPAGR